MPRAVILASAFVLAAALFSAPDVGAANPSPGRVGAVNDTASLVVHVRRGGGVSRRAMPTFRAGHSIRGSNAGFRGGSLIRHRGTVRTIRPVVRPKAVKTGRFAHRPFVLPHRSVRWHRRHLAVKRWRRHRYYGRVIGGVTIGALLAAPAYVAYLDGPPAPGLCWYWADPGQQRGYWDYCDGPL